MTKENIKKISGIIKTINTTNFKDKPKYIAVFLANYFKDIDRNFNEDDFVRDCGFIL